VAPRSVAPYFVLVTLIHVAAVVSRFDVVAAKLPPTAPTIVMIVQFPLILLSGYFESKLDYGPSPSGFPRWMLIKSRPVKLAFTFAFIYISCVALQTWDVSIGPINPTPPAEWPVAQRAAWFAMFTAGMFFPFYLAATSLLIPILRVLVRPIRGLPAAVACIIALALGGGIGVVVFAAVTSEKLGAFIAGVKQAFADNPSLGIALTARTIFGPMLVGLIAGKRET
jgi:hypothetical protein